MRGRILAVLAVLLVAGCASSQPTPDEVCTNRFGADGDSYWRCMDLIARQQAAFQASQAQLMSGAAANGALVGGAAGYNAFATRPQCVWSQGGGSCQ